MAPQLLQPAGVAVLGKAEFAFDALQLAIAAISLHQRADEELGEDVQCLK